MSDDNIGFNFLITNNTTDTDLPAQTLTYNLNTTVTNAVLDTNYRVFNWRPLVTQANMTIQSNLVEVVERWPTDNFARIFRHLDEWKFNES